MGGIFHAKGWWPKSSCPPSKVCFPWVSKRGIWDVPGILPGCPGPLGVTKKFVQKKFVRIFRSLPKAGQDKAGRSDLCILQLEPPQAKTRKVWKMLGGFWQNGFFAVSIFEPPDFFCFFCGFCRRIFLLFCGEKCPENPPRKSPTKSSQIYTTKIPDTFLQRGRAKKCGLPLRGPI